MTSAAPGTETHHLFVRAEKCLVRMLLNGFPVVELDPSGMTRSTAPPVNQLLVGARNELAVTLWPLPDAERAMLRDVVLEGSVRSFAPTDPWAQSKGGAAVIEVGIDRDLTQWAKAEDIELPLSLATYRFDSEGLSFRARLAEAEPIDDPARIVHYGLTLRDLLAACDGAGIARELDPKMQDYALAYHGSVNDLRRELDDYLRDKVFVRGPLVDFGPDEIEATPWCGGRLWRLRRAPGQPFIQTREDAEGLDCRLEVFVGLVDGELRIVR